MQVLVHGRVQMVGYRMFTEQEATRIGSISGTVRNLADGLSVEVIAEGARTDLEKLLEELRVGPPHALVREVEVSWHEATGECDGFATIL